MKPNATHIQPNTLGNIAQKYGIDVRTLVSLIEPNADLKKEVDKYTADVKLKGQKMLPLSVVEMIYKTLGQPNY